MIVQICQVREDGVKCPLIATTWIEWSYRSAYGRREVTKTKAACPAHAEGWPSLGPVVVTKREAA